MTSLVELRERFLATSTISMPLAGLIVWSILGIAALFVPKALVGWMAVYAMAAILPLAFAIEKLRGRNPFVKDDNPVSKLFFQSIIGIGLMFPAGHRRRRGRRQSRHHGARSRDPRGYRLDPLRLGSR